MMPRVSAVIACYNHGRFVDGAVESILSQTYQDTEIIVVNDGSTDEHTNRLLEDYRGPRTRVIRTDNKGPGAARNTGIGASTGELILNLDADDRFRRSFLEKAVSILDSHPDVGIVGCWAQTYGDYRYVIRYSGGTVVDALNGMGCAAGSLFRRQCWDEAGGYDESIKIGYEDWDFYLAVLANGWTCRTIPEILMDYRKSHGSRCDLSGRDAPLNKRRLVEKHLSLYSENVVEALHGRDLEIQRQLRLIESIYASPRYKIGGLFTVPFQRLWRAAKRLAGKQEEEIY